MRTWEQIEQTVKEAVDRGDFPSAAIGIGDRERTYVCAAFGNTSITEDKRPVSIRTLYDVASLTKIMATSMVAFRMIEEGKLRLNDRISEFLLAPMDKQDVTVLQVMTHTAGFSADFRLEEMIQEPEAAARCILRRPLFCPPGKRVVYSCMGYILLGRMLEEIGGQGLDELTRKMVFEPLGMESAGFRPFTDVSAALDEGMRQDIAWTEWNEELGWYWTGVVHDENARFLRGVSGNAGVFCNLEDIMKFGRMLVRDGDSFLSRAMLHTAIRNYTPQLGEYRGLGFQIKDDFSFFGDLMGPRSYGHNGFTGTSLVVDPDTGLYVALLTNRVHPKRENDTIFRFRHVIHNMAAAAYTGRERT